LSESEPEGGKSEDEKQKEKQVERCENLNKDINLIISGIPSFTNTEIPLHVTYQEMSHILLEILGTCVT